MQRAAVVVALCLMALVGCGGAEFTSGPMQEEELQAPPDAPDAQGEVAILPDMRHPDAANDGRVDAVDPMFDAGVEAAPSPRDSGLDANGSVDATPDVVVPPTCSGQCIAPPPSGWAGPVEIFQGSTQATCSAAYATMTVLHDGLQAAGASCGCSCGAPESVTCQIAVGGYCAGSGFCNGNVTPYGTLTSGECAVQSGDCSPVELGSPVASGGSCAPSASKTVTPAAWTDTTTACAPTVNPTTVGCTQGVCASPADPSFHMCIQAPGDVSCPAGPYQTKHVEYSGVNDTRDCSSCSCGAPSGVTCGGQVKVAPGNDPTCAGTIGGPYPVPNCVGAQTGVRLQYIASPSGGTCAPQGGQATGSAAPTGATTFCCL